MDIEGLEKALDLQACSYAELSRMAMRCLGEGEQTLLNDELVAGVLQDDTVANALSLRGDLGIAFNVD